MDEQRGTARRSAGVVAAACTQGKRTQQGKPHGVAGDGQSDAGDGWSERSEVADRPVVQRKPSNSGGGKGPWFKANAQSSKERRLGNLSTPERVQKLRMALHAKAKAEPGYRFYALYDKIYRGTSWPMPGRNAAPTRARPAWTGRTSRISRRTAWSNGSGNWRLRSGKRRSDRTRFGGCISPRPTARCVPWASRL
jgi:hypothetical protein